MNIFRVKNKIFTLAAICMIFALAQAELVQAQSEGLLQINFQNGNNEPLFSEANFLPGDQVVRYVDVLNQSDESQAVVVKASNVSDPDGLAEWMTIDIDLYNGQPDSLLYQASLAEFFAEQNIYLNDINPGTEDRYYFSVKMSLDVPEGIQEKKLFFDIVMGEGTLESFASETGSDSSSSVSSFVYNQLELTNVAVTPGTNSAVITWDTNKQATSRVVFDTLSHPDLEGTQAPNYGYSNSTIQTDAPASISGTINHSVTIVGLSANTTYYFRPISSASPERKGQELSFTTGQSATLEPKLTIKKSKESVFLRSQGEDAVYTVTVNNEGKGTALAVKLEDELPAGAVFADSGQAKKTWQLGDIKPGEYKELSYVVEETFEKNDNSDGDMQVLAYNHKTLSEILVSDNTKKASALHISHSSPGLLFLLVFVIFAFLLSVLGFFYRRI